MRIVPVEDHVRERTHRDWAAERVEAGRRKHENRIKGLPVLRQMDNGREWEYRARLYHAPPVPYEVALDALDVQQRYDALVLAGKRHLEAPDQFPPLDVQEWRSVCREVARLFKHVWKPVGWRRLFWFLTPSPMRNATPAEVGRALSFFSGLQTRDAIDSLLQETAEFPTGTSPAASTASSPPTRPSAGVASPGPRFGRNHGKPSSPGSR